MKQVHSQLQRAQLQKRQSRLEQYGEINVLGDYTHYNIERTLAPLVPSAISSGSPVVTSKDIFSLGLSYNVPLFTGFAQTRQLEIDTLSQEMAKAKLTLTREELVYNIRSLYLSVLAQQEIHKAQHFYTKALKTLSKKIAYEVTLGKKAKIDLLKAQSDLASAKTQEALFLSNIKTTKATLSSLVGKKVTTLKTMHINVQEPHDDISTYLLKYQHLAKVKVEDMEIKKAEKMISKSKASQLPQVSLNSYTGKNYAEDVKTHNNEDENIWQVGVHVNYNLIDFGKRDTAVQKVAIAKLEAALKKEQLLLDLKKSLIQAIEKVKQDYITYQGHKIQVRLNKKSQKIEQVRYNEEVSTLNDLLLAKGKRWLAQAKMIESKYNYQKSIYYIDYLMERGTK